MVRRDKAGRPKVSARRQRLGLWTVTVIGVLGGGLALVGSSMSHSAINGGDWQGQASLVAITALPSVLLIVLLILLRYSGRRDRHVAQVRQSRPDSVVIPAYTSVELLSDAVAAGARTHGISREFPTTLAIAIFRDDAEVWIHKDREPRWSVRLADAQVEVLRISLGEGTSQLGLRISDGTRAVSFVPHYGLVMATNISSVKRVLTYLGEDPSEHLDP